MTLSLFVGTVRFSLATDVDVKNSDNATVNALGLASLSCPIETFVNAAKESGAFPALRVCFNALFSHSLTPFQTLLFLESRIWDAVVQSLWPMHLSSRPRRSVLSVPFR
jgi:hypothetical protein